MKYLITLITLVSFTAGATECAKPMHYLTEGTAAPCTGYLASPEQEKFFRQLELDKQFAEDKFALQSKLVAKQQEIIETADLRVTLLTEQTHNLQNELAKEQSFWYRALYVGVGIVAGAFIYKGYEWVRNR